MDVITYFLSLDTLWALQWWLLVTFLIILIMISPKAKSIDVFFKWSSISWKEPGLLILTMSLFISWIFSKSIANAAALGKSFWIVGGLSYSAYYLSFFVAGYIIYKMRVNGWFKSIHEFLLTKFWKIAVSIFSVAIAFRLFNEVWSNTKYIGLFFGEVWTSGYIIAIIAFTILTLIYSLKWGLRSSILTDLIQAILFWILLFLILGIIIPETPGGFSAYISSGEWGLSTWLNLFFVALLQIMSYPFHDPVMTDRGFIAEAKKTRKAFYIAWVLWFISILLFSFIGIFENIQNIEWVATIWLSSYFSGMMFTIIFLLVNFIMITSASSTLDSTFFSSTKLVISDLGKKSWQTLFTWRLVMILVAIAWSLPLFWNPEIIAATTVSGTMVIWLAPVFIFWFMKSNIWAFLSSFFVWIFFGFMLVLNKVPEWMYFSDWKYADLLAVNVYGTLISFTLFLLLSFILPSKKIWKIS